MVTCIASSASICGIRVLFAVSHSAQMCSSTSRIVGAIGLNDIVFDEGSGGPTIESNQTVVISIYGSGVIDGSA